MIVMMNLPADVVKLTSSVFRMLCYDRITFTRIDTRLQVKYLASSMIITAPEQKREPK